MSQDWTVILEDPDLDQHTHVKIHPTPTTQNLDLQVPKVNAGGGLLVSVAGSGFQAVEVSAGFPRTNTSNRFLNS